VNPPDIGQMENENLFAALLATFLQIIVAIVAAGFIGLLAYGAIMILTG
jgi:hypothetical protein